MTIMASDLSLSVALISLNEADNLPRTLDAVKDIANEIVIMDSGSTDETVRIADNYGAKVIHQPWLGYAQQKNALFEHCSQDWILNLDCDEVLTYDLCEEIKRILRQPRYDGYRIDRQTHYLGKLMHYSWRPDRKLRLVRRSANPVWQGYRVHERLTIHGTISDLVSPVIHYSYRDFDDHMQKTLRYARLAGEGAFAEGRRFHWYKLFLNPWVAFLRMYLFRFGFLDGIRGLFAALSAGFYTLMKYSYLWECQRKAKQKP